MCSVAPFSYLLLAQHVGHLSGFLQTTFVLALVELVVDDGQRLLDAGRDLDAFSSEHALAVAAEAQQRELVEELLGQLVVGQHDELHADLDERASARNGPHERRRLELVPKVPVGPLLHVLAKLVDARVRALGGKDPRGPHESGRRKRHVRSSAAANDGEGARLGEVDVVELAGGVVADGERRRRRRGGSGSRFGVVRVGVVGVAVAVAVAVVVAAGGVRLELAEKGLERSRASRSGRADELLGIERLLGLLHWACLLVREGSERVESHGGSSSSGSRSSVGTIGTSASTASGRLPLPLPLTLALPPLLLPLLLLLLPIHLPLLLASVLLGGRNHRGNGKGARGGGGGEDVANSNGESSAEAVLVKELDLLLRGVNVDVHVRAGNLQREVNERPASSRKEVVVHRLDRPPDSRRLDEPVVDEDYKGGRRSLHAVRSVGDQAGDLVGKSELVEGSSISDAPGRVSRGVGGVESTRPKRLRAGREREGEEEKGKREEKRKGRKRKTSKRQVKQEEGEEERVEKEEEL